MDAGRLTRDLQARLDERANRKTKAWWEAYLKHVIPFRGTKMAGIRSVLHEWYREEEIAGRSSPDEQKSLALALFREEYAEDKIAGILFLQEILLPAGVIDWESDLPRFAELFQGGWIYDWNVCDWFCVKVLGPLAETEGEACARAISEWRRSENLWQRRASGVAFVNLAGRGDKNFAGFTELLLEICAVTVQHQERFSQTGTGWVLRELSVAEPEKVERFVAERVCDFSREGLRSALEKMPDPSRDRLKGLRAQCGETKR
jgi:3-methyladenine DNA glycosylase AlkD